MKLLLQTHSSNGEYDADISCAVVDITREYARELVQKHDIFMKVKKEQSDAHELYFWDSQAEYACNSDVDYPEEEISETTIEISAARTECDQLVVRERGVAWTMIPKHTDIYITTSEVEIEKIRDLASDNLDKMGGAVEPRRRRQRKGS